MIGVPITAAETRPQAHAGPVWPPADDRKRPSSPTFPEIRFRREVEGGLTLFILSAHPEPDPTLALELIGLLTEVWEPIHGAVTVDPAKRSYHAFTKADELSTEQLDLEWAGYEEGEQAGAIPGA